MFYYKKYDVKHTLLLRLREHNCMIDKQIIPEKYPGL